MKKILLILVFLLAAGSLFAGDLRTISVDGTPGLFVQSYPMINPDSRISFFTGGITLKSNTIFPSGYAIMFDLSWSHLLAGRYKDFENPESEGSIEVSDYKIYQFIHFSVCLGYAVVNTDQFFLVLGGGISLDYTGSRLKTQEMYLNVLADGFLVKANMGLRFSRSVFLDFGLELGFDYFAIKFGKDDYNDRFFEKYDDFRQIYLLPSVGIGFIY